MIASVIFVVGIIICMVPAWGLVYIAESHKVNAPTISSAQEGGA